MSYGISQKRWEKRREIRGLGGSKDPGCSGGGVGARRRQRGVRYPQGVRLFGQWRTTVLLKKALIEKSRGKGGGEQEFRFEEKRFTGKVLKVVGGSRNGEHFEAGGGRGRKDRGLKKSGTLKANAYHQAESP